MTDTDQNTREHLETIVHHAHAYRIHVAGEVDGQRLRDPVGYGPYAQTWENNLSLRLENIGDDIVHNPWVVVNGKRCWRSLAEILAEIIDEEMSDGEKARRIWEFARRHRYHGTTGDDEVKDSVKMLNVYGYTLCWDEAYTVANLWQAAGLPVRRGIPHGHCTTEVHFDDGYHLLDSDEHLLYLLRDNRTIASEEDLAGDHDLVKRGHAYGVLHAEDRRTDEQTAAIFVHAGPRAGGRPQLTQHTMELDLRPGEALIWEWGDRGKYHGRGSRPPLMANGRMTYTPRLDASYSRWATRTENLRSEAAGLVPEDPERQSVLVYHVASPYVCVGGSVRHSPGWKLELTFDGAHWENVSGGDLDPHFPATAMARYGYQLRLSATGHRLDDLYIETDVQMAPLSLPALEVGDNEVRYMDATQGSRRVRLVHSWRERRDISPPPAPSRPRHPEPGATTDGTRITFVWDPVPGAADYEFRLSEYRDMRWALSPVFEKLISRTPTAGGSQWQVPHAGLLNPGRSYYWQVRARNDAGVWGAWGPVWRFVSDGPGVPLEVRLQTDWEQRTVELRWTPNPQGAPADHYEIYGADERGFTAHREPYTRLQGRDQGDAPCAANLIATTTDTRLRVVGPEVAAGAGNRTFYRVVAMDGHGHRSGPSDYAEAPHPFVYTLPPPQAKAGEAYRYQVQALASAGDLSCRSNGAQRYDSAFRDADELLYLLDEGPDFVHLDEATGLLTATPDATHLGFHTITFRVISRQGGADAQGFDLEVVP